MNSAQLENVVVVEPWTDKFTVPKFGIFVEAVCLLGNVQDCQSYIVEANTLDVGVIMQNAAIMPKTSKRIVDFKSKYPGLAQRQS